MARTIHDWLSAFLPSIERTTRTADDAATSPHAGRREPSAIARYAARTLERTLNGPVGRWLMAHMNPVNAIVGPVEMKLLPSECGRKASLGTAVTYVRAPPLRRVLAPNRVLDTTWPPAAAASAKSTPPRQ